MPKIKTSELIGPALDWAVAKCEGIDPPYGWDAVKGQKEYLPFSTSWGLGGPIIERELIAVDWDHDTWNAAKDGLDWYVSGPTLLAATMRCYVASKLGDEAEVPDALNP